ncbi:MAG: hypothetical protein Q7U98_16985 [Methylicorpusculum sp.]|uniref:DUF4870 family protein n=1 Tax=Methylicorpusculum sp. TaxID=2713644 RepID=UPI00271B4AE8|nr:hypothetical protein [Methylicorpusculum sp.]MDO8842903.1 hypothetical protein [Methylicorpusculum sp.]MDO8940852.1 hypothetical protein [Methylicorpusculum sp.]MDP2204384.1 hypothetical protein [Methylicorpusculum sp.]
MNDIMNTPSNDEQIKSLKKLTAIVYLCQVLTFGFAGIPLIVGVIINFVKREQVRGTWLESHFEWQITTAWMTLAGLTLSALTFQVGIGFFILIPTILLYLYRIAIGWYALHADKPVKEPK